MAAKKNLVEAALRALARDLAAINARWALVGGLAVSARAEPRTTRDVDVAVHATSEAEAERIVFDLQSRGYRVCALLEQRRARRLATVRLVHGSRPTILCDLLFGSSGIEPEIVAGAQFLEVLPRLRLPVARVGDLVAMKLLARDDRRRPQDADDLRELLRVANAADLARARRAIGWIETRGASRRRDLRAGLARARREARRAP